MPSRAPSARPVQRSPDSLQRLPALAAVRGADAELERVRIGCGHGEREPLGVQPGAGNGGRRRHRTWSTVSTMEAGDLDRELRAAARERGVATHYFDVAGREIEVPVDTLRHVLDVLGPPPAPDAPAAGLRAAGGSGAVAPRAAAGPSSTSPAAAPASCPSSCRGRCRTAGTCSSCASGRCRCWSHRGRRSRPPTAASGGLQCSCYALRSAAAVGDRRPRRPRAAAGRDGMAGLRPAVAAARPGAGAAGAAEPVLRHLPPRPQPAPRGGGGRPEVAALSGDERDAFAALAASRRGSRSGR